MALKARDLKLNSVHHGATVHALPCIAGHLGADNVGVMLAQGDLLDDRLSLIVDIGTNAEILLATRERLLSASTLTDPALEGAQITHGQRAAPGAIERVRIDPDRSDIRYRVIGDPRWSDNLDPGESLRSTGICGSGVVEVVSGLFHAGHGARMALLNAGERLEAQRKANEVEYVELAAEPSFQSHFVEAMKLPHAQDSFPHLEGMLPAKVGSQRGQRRRNRMSVPTLDTAEHTAQ